MLKPLNGLRLRMRNHITSHSTKPSKNPSYSCEGCRGKLTVPEPGSGSPTCAARSRTHCCFTGKPSACGKIMPQAAVVTLPYSSPLMKLPSRPKV